MRAFTLNLTVEVVRSPAKMAWWVMMNNQRVAVKPTKWEAEAEANELRKLVGTSVHDKRDASRREFSQKTFC
ncbi:hypothetical protein D3C85_167040 [compost metagenome]